ncbi:Coiled-coil domain-containing protein 12 [Acipenser ruthenus]|uniref:Coiled-coil domain-containing protein 12 n=1 Tax=Acipenser ruthenus TaxID=7906 RepID=A0A662YY77_ACIRT|nr:Coiled-coil domain-containing protein 12 [Acipenser ruthenus]
MSLCHLTEIIENRDPEDGEPENKRSLEEIEEVKHRELKLRNYTPEDEELWERQVPKVKLASVEEKVRDQLEAANPEPLIEEVDLANLAPRKPDWDLKRDVAKKLEKLEKRTQRAIAELILLRSEKELHEAAKRNDTQAVLALLKSNVHVNATDSVSELPLEQQQCC